MDAAALGRLVPARLKPVVRRPLVRYRRRGLDPADTLLVSYPKSGTTWLRMLLGSALSGADLDFDSVRAQLPPMGAHQQAPRLLRGGGRVVRTHEPLGGLGPIPCRVLYLVRDGRDVAASYYHHVRRVGRFRGTPEEFLGRFLAGGLDGYGTWATHVDDAGRRSADGDRMSVVRYEDLRRDTAGALARIFTDIGEMVDDVALAQAIAANTKPRMADKERTSRLLAQARTDGSSVVRPDGAPGWRDVFPAAHARRLEAELEAGLARFGYL